jgi:hypothetical protein
MVYGKQKRASVTMNVFGVPLRDLLIPGLLVLWVLLNLVVLPRMGIST